MSKIKNIFSEKFRKPYPILNSIFKPKINGYIVNEALIIENGTDEEDGMQKPYLVLKIYLDEDV